MHSRWFTSPLWYHALTLAERNALLLGDPAAPRLSDKNAARGQRRLERWRAQPPFTDDAYFARCLAIDSIDPERLLFLLGAPATWVQARVPQMPDWLEQLANAYTHSSFPYEAPPIDEAADDEGAQDDPADDEAVLGFLELIQPLIEQACDRLQAGVDELVDRGDALPFDPDTVVDLLLVNLLDPLLMRLSRTLVLELHVARLRGLLAGDTPEARFASFVERLHQPDVALAILAEYPVLARQLTLCIDQWVTVSLEFLTRLCADWSSIRRCFCPDADPGPLLEVAGGAGDTHRGGRSVMIASFESGFRIVYKPKSLAVDHHFQELLAWLNRRGCQPPLYVLTLLDRGAYGWVEFVEPQGCGTPDEVARFYQRHGAYLALLYALNANDFHFENLIAAGEHPVLIDLETLLQPQFDTFDETRAEFAAEQVITNSVLQVSLLPLRMWSSEDYTGIDISGLGGTAGQLSPDRLPQLTGTGTDAMRYVRQRVEIAGGAHRPTLKGAELNAADYVDDVIAGFVRMYRLLTDQRADLLADGGPISRFAHDEIRVLLRQTRTYDQLLFESFHPDMLRDAVERDRFLDRLWIATVERPYLALVVQAEQRGLHQGDIPLFTTHPASLTLFGGSGEAIDGVLHEDGMTVVRRRLQQMDEDDLRLQTWFIRASFATLAADPTADQLPPQPVPEIKGRVNATRLMANVRAIADHLVAAAIHGDEDAAWIGLELLDNQTWTIRSLGIDLYNGIAGVALFLAYAGALVPEDRYTALARRAMNTLVWQADMLGTEMLKIGGYYGWGGVLYTFTHLSALWDDPQVRSHAAALVDTLASHIAQDDEFDVARGSAGAIIALLAFHRHVRSDRALADHVLQVAMACGDHLLASAQPQEQGVGWALPAYGDSPLLGLAHGIAGIAWALLALAAVTGKEEYRQTAQQAIAHERSRYASTATHHPKQHDPSTAVQLGLARWCVQSYLETPRLYDELPRIIPTLQNDAVRQPHSLIQGAMGSLDLMMLAAWSANDGGLHTQIDQLAARVVASIEQDGWRCSVPQAVAVPGLMRGLSGIGYQMLRLAAPTRVPSALILAPPLCIDQPDAQPARG